MLFLTMAPTPDRGWGRSDQHIGRHAGLEIEANCGIEASDGASHDWEKCSSGDGNDSVPTQRRYVYREVAVHAAGTRDSAGQEPAREREDTHEPLKDPEPDPVRPVQI